MKDDPVLQTIARQIVREGVLRWGSFANLKYHRQEKGDTLSPFYFDFHRREDPHKEGPLTYSTLQMIAGRLVQEAIRREVSFHYVAGVPDGATPFAEEFCRMHTQAQENPGIYHLHLEKAEGGVEVANKVLRGGLPVLLIEDCVTGGFSLAEAIDGLYDRGFHVAHVLAVMDRGQGGIANIRQKYGCPADALLSAPEFFSWCLRKKLIDGAQFWRAGSYILDNQLTL